MFPESKFPFCLDMSPGLTHLQATSAYPQCQYEGRIPNNVQMVRVEPDGRYWYESMNASRGSTDLEQCIREKIAAMAAAKRSAAPAR